MTAELGAPPEPAPAPAERPRRAAAPTPPGGDGAASAPPRERPAVSPLLLGAVVVVSGAASLATEICASRLLAPFFGSSTVVWANVIGLVLLSLAVGYWLGGRLADRLASAAGLGAVLLAAAATIALLPFIAHPILRAALDGVARFDSGAVVGSFASTLVLFAPPVVLLGMASPFALRLAVTRVGAAGSVAGRLSSLGTLGALAGTFGSALVTIPAVGTQRTLLGSAFLVALAGLALTRTRAAALLVVAVGGLVVVPPGQVKPVSGLLEERETAYQYAAVIDTGDRRVLRLDDGVADQSVWRPQTALTGGEWDMPLVVPPLLGRPLRRVLVIGNAAGTTARALAATYPGVAITGVEIDPVLTELGRRWFGLGEIPSLDVATADGRAWLATHDERFDLVVVDAYREAYIPFQLATREFFSLVRAHLTPGGAVALNVARVPEDDRLPEAVAGTLASVVPATYVWPALRFNVLVLALDAPLGGTEIDARLGDLPAPVASLGPLVRTQMRAVAASADPMTDDRAPVEWLADRAVIAHVARGGRFDDHLLPTYPG